MSYTVTESVLMSRYRPYHGVDIERPCFGAVVREDAEYGINRHTFHPYSGARPVHCAPPAAGRTYHSNRGYA